MTNLAFTQQGERWVSDVLTADSSNIAIRVEFLNEPGEAYVERSITGNDWVVAGTIANALNTSKFLEMNVSGSVSSQPLRIVTTREPALIGYL